MRRWLRPIGLAVGLTFFAGIGQLRAQAMTLCLEGSRSVVGAIPPDTAPWSAIMRAAVAEMRDRAAGASPRDAAVLSCVAAELLKRLGDARADAEFRAAIATDPANPELWFLYGDYLRGFRGPGRSLVPAAERRYYEALRRFPAGRQPTCPESELACLIRRSLVALYERDGLPFGGAALEQPHVFLSVQGFGGRFADQANEVDDVRDFTSEMLYASHDVLARELNDDSLRLFLRPRDQVDVLTRLRFRYNPLPAIDVYHRHRVLWGSQIADFRVPDRVTDVQVETIGVGLESVFGSRLVDVLLRGDVRGSRRWGLIEYLPRAREDVASLSARTVLTRPVGPDRIDLELVLAIDDIAQQIAQPIERSLHVVAPTLRYRSYRRLTGSGPFEQRIAPRGVEGFIGLAHYNERFGSAELRKRDRFLGVTVRGLPGVRPGQSFDITVQPTRLTAERAGRDSSGLSLDPLRTSTVRLLGTILYRVADHENQLDLRLLPRIVFVNFVLTGHHDFQDDGPGAYRSFLMGGGFDARIATPEPGAGATLLVSARYDLQRFFALERTQHHASLSLSVGF